MITSSALRHRSRVRLARVVSLLLPVSIVAAGCGDGGGNPPLPEVQVVDSAGIRIVTHAPGIFSAGIFSGEARVAAPFAPDLDAGPAVRIGVVEGEEAYQFTNPVGGARLADGTIVVLDRQSRSLRFFDAEGRHLRSVGRQGDGPGEFQTPGTLVHLPGDTLVVIDIMQQRVHWFASDGRFVRDASPAILGLPGRPVTLTPGIDGDLLVTTVPPGTAGATPESGLMREELHLMQVRVDTDDGTFRATRIGAVGGTERELFVSSSAGQVTGIEIRGHWFLRQFLNAPGVDGLWTADGVGWEVILRGAPSLSGDGRLPVHTIVRFDDPIRPFDAAARDTVERGRLAAIHDPEARERIREGQGSYEYPANVPAIRSLFSDREGRLWIAPVEIPIRTLPSGMGSAATNWFVLSPEGSALGWIEIPPDSRPLWASNDGVLLVRVDELDVPRIEWWPGE